MGRKIKMVNTGWIKDSLHSKSWTKENYNLDIVPTYSPKNIVRYYTIVIEDSHTGKSLWLNSKKFKTKSQAIKFAENYMRTH
jgi:hypothetical protein